MSAVRLADSSAEGGALMTTPEMPDRVLGGACAEVARRLNAPVGFVRGLVLLGALLSQPYVVYVYLVVVLLLPQRGRSWPGPHNVVGLLRVGLLVGVVAATSAGNLGIDGLFNQSPAIWVPQAGVSLAAIVALLASWPVSDEQDRALTAASLVTLAVAAAIVVGMIVTPGLRWERVIYVAVACAGAVLVIRGRRDDGRALLLPVLTAASGALLLMASGARLQGGIGHLDVRPDSVSALQPSYRRAIGSLDVDLSRLTSGGQVAALSLSVGIGNVDLTLPTGASVEIYARVGRGTLLLQNAEPVSGVGINRRIEKVPGWPPVGQHARIRLRITAAVGIGTLNIHGPDGERGP